MAKLGQKCWTGKEGEKSTNGKVGRMRKEEKKMIGRFVRPNNQLN